MVGIYSVDVKGGSRHADGSFESQLACNYENNGYFLHLYACISVTWVGGSWKYTVRGGL